MNAALLSVNELTVRYGSNTVLDSISVQINRGEHVALVGQNGAGKSTLLRSIAGLLAPSSGSVTLHGAAITEIERRDLARLVAFVPQGFMPTFPVTVEELVLMSRYPFRSPLAGYGREDLDKVRQALEQTGTAHLEKRFINSLSGGERQRVLLAGALAQDAELLILDEPFTGLDFYYQEELALLLETLRQGSARTVLLATHDLNWSARIAGRLLALKGGSLVFDGTPDAFMTEEPLRRVFNKGFTLVEHPTRGHKMIVPS